jgi:hypothetical protein
MGVGIDEAWCHGEPMGVNDFLAVISIDCAYKVNDLAGDADVGTVGRQTRAIDHRTILDDEIVRPFLHDSPSLSASTSSSVKTKENVCAKGDVYRFLCPKSAWAEQVKSTVNNSDCQSAE